MHDQHNTSRPASFFPRNAASTPAALTWIVDNPLR